MEASRAARGFLTRPTPGNLVKVAKVPQSACRQERCGASGNEGLVFLQSIALCCALLLTAQETPFGGGRHFEEQTKTEACG
jgi:hypothetical protein